MFCQCFYFAGDAGHVDDKLNLYNLLSGTVRVRKCYKYTEYLTNKERLTGPISPSKLCPYGQVGENPGNEVEVIFDKFVLHNLLYCLNWIRREYYNPVSP